MTPKQIYTGGDGGGVGFLSIQVFNSCAWRGAAADGMRRIVE